ncbi:MAG: hypothetical protein WCI87_06970 [Euryarchaeota archaeon]
MTKVTKTEQESKKEQKDHKYKKIIGQSVKSDDSGDFTYVPYGIEARLVKKSDPNAPAEVKATFNQSVTYSDDPFQFHGSYVKVGKSLQRVDSLGDFLRDSKFTRARGVDLVVNVVNPAPEFTDKAKTHINAYSFKDDLLKATRAVTKDAIKEVERAEKQNRRQNRSYSINYSLPRTNKEDFMTDLFDTAYERAKGKYAAVTARQIFYVLRPLVKAQYGEDLTQSDYNRFTQNVCTEFKTAGYKIMFDRRGFFVNPFTGDEMPLGTWDVEEYIEGKIRDCIYPETRIIYSVPPEQLFNKVLFIEKQGFTPLFKAEDILSELHLGVISTSGFGTRACKMLMQYYIGRGIVVYVLHDCDIAGYLIADKLKHGSKTFPYPLEVTDIGLTVQDLGEKGLDKLYLAETVGYKTRQPLRQVRDPEAREFFDVDGELTSENYEAYYGDHHTYRRIEINALTNDELLEYIRDKIHMAPVIPDHDTLENHVTNQFNDKEALVKEALYKAFIERHDVLSDGDGDENVKEALNVDIVAIIGDIINDVNAKEESHWIYALQSHSDEVKSEIVEKLVGKLDNVSGVTKVAILQKNL